MCKLQGNLSDICRVQVKLYADILLQRLKDVGAEQRISKTQYGFKAGCGTADALLMARRILDNAAQLAEGRLLLVALDWSRASDSIAPQHLIWALRRFGFPEEFVCAIHGIYQERKFFVRESGVDSAWHSQEFGIVQGCPLSPFLFSIAMTCLLTDADTHIKATYGPPTMPGLTTRSLLYADDTLLVETDVRAVQEYMDTIRTLGQEYGLQLNDSKLEVLAVGHDGQLYDGSGRPAKHKASMVYLGSLLSADGRIGAELSRRIGGAQSAFAELTRVWRHANISKARKMRLYDSCVVSRLMYCIHTAWLNEKKRLDAFHCRCLRRIHGIKDAYYSRVSNADVLAIAGSKPMRNRLLDHQLQLYGHIARKDDGDPIREAVLTTYTIRPRKHEGRRRVGRPRHQLNNEVFRIALKVAGNTANLAEMLANTETARARWKTACRKYIDNI